MIDKLRRFLKQTFEAMKTRYLTGTMIPGFIVLILCLTRCNVSPGPGKKGNNVDSLLLARGEVLFAQHCQTCHLLPVPAHLPKEIWHSSVLPLMAIRMGLNTSEYQRTISAEERAIEEKNNLISKTPLLSLEDYELIQKYIEFNAPDTLAYATERLYRNQPITQFIRRNIPVDASNPSTITALKFNVATNILWIGNLYNQVIQWQWGKGVIATDNTASPVVDFTFYNNTYFTEIGSLLPSELSSGSFSLKSANLQETVLQNLHRPVCTLMDDFDKDNIAEIIVGNFGKNLGSLSLYKKNKKDNTYDEYPLLTMPGATKCYLKDMDNDGRKDVVALFAQADESVYIFFQKDSMHFEPKKVLRFPPDYGTTDMVLVDYNKDGLTDIITANGDNADYSIVLKKYHGIRIHINAGNNTFKESFFYPVYGATKVLAEDFDKDGDIDLAINAFYPDFGELLRESFVYLQNDNSKQYSFTSFTQKNGVPVKSLALEKADIDGDGDMDIILGNFSESPIEVPEYVKQKWKEAQYGLIIFENQLYH